MTLVVEPLTDVGYTFTLTIISLVGIETEARLELKRLVTLVICIVLSLIRFLVFTSIR